MVTAIALWMNYFNVKVGLAMRDLTVVLYSEISVIRVIVVILLPASFTEAPE